MGNRFDLLNDDEKILYEDAKCFEPYPNEKIRMKLHTGEKREQLKESIIKNGILTPIIAIPSSRRGILTCISGWNRISICSELNLKIPYQLKTDLTQEQADLICIDTNLLNRQVEEYLPSELSSILKIKYDILKHQGKRNDLINTSTSGNDCTKLADDYKLSKRSIQNYIRLTYLNDNLLKMVDDKSIQLVSGVSLSYLKENEQQQLSELLLNENYRINPKIAELLKKFSSESEDNITIKNVIDEINNTIVDKTDKVVKITTKELREFIPPSDLKNAKQIIKEALELYYKRP